ncbi:AAA family ATPase [Phormidium sp. CCY1219]|uniref:AAA family ATPase n=1 Tax=Phormidium sp. CCY1219 TaxID=2886104 RepID=UPI002D1F47E4|nr:AAA family ATPase [Phormidium sp. CCY1219]MEB3828548.1 AAA family ATPase [Phormidium sp. CCY1219]
MKLETLEYHDREYNWKLDRVEFSANPTLLVGRSGAGKTQVLRSIHALKKIANGGSLNGVKWDACFLTSQGQRYRWQGEFETQKHLLGSQAKSDKEYKLIKEKLEKSDKIIVDRSAEKILFNGIQTPKLSPSQSTLHLLKQEEEISFATEEINKIILADLKYGEQISTLSVSLLNQYENASLKDIQESELPLSLKLSLVYRTFPEVFQKIKEKVREIFSEIEDIKIEALNLDDIPVVLAELLRESTVVYFKEKGVNDWIKQVNISSGMLKALMYVSELYLSPKGSLILIDEFENSLGVNCIDSMTDILLENKELQFIITSHHPYIINNISPKHWKIVTRQGGVVQVKDSQDLGIAKSRHKAFIDLINILEEYPEGIEEE